MPDFQKARGEITHYLQQWAAGDSESLDQLIAQLYNELHQAAGFWLRANPIRHSLPPTALVSELYLKLTDLQNANFQSREQFFGFAGMVMRQITVDAARARSSKKRGGDQFRIPEANLGSLPASDNSVEKIFAIHEALNAFETLEPRKAKAIELRFFGGFSKEEIATALGVSPITIHRDLAIAKIWLARKIDENNIPKP